MSRGTLTRQCKRLLATYPEPVEEEREWRQADILEKIVDSIEEDIKDDYIITRSRTEPLPYIPAIGISHPHVNHGMRSGLSITLLFDTVDDRLCLTLSQGIKSARQDVRGTSEGLSEAVFEDKLKNHLERQSARLRDRISNYQDQIEDSHKFSPKRLYFDSSLITSSNKNYGIAVVVNRTYSNEKLGQECDLSDDLMALVNRYDDLVESGNYEEVIHSDPSYDIFWYDQDPHRSSRASTTRIARAEHTENDIVQFEVYDINVNKDQLYHVGTGFSSEQEMSDELQSAVALRVVDPSESETEVQSNIGERMVGVSKDSEIEKLVQSTTEKIASRYELNWGEL